MRRSALVLAMLASCVGAAQVTPHAFDLIDVNYDINLRPKEGRIDGIVVNTLVPKPGARQVTLHAGPMRILKIKVDGRPVRFNHRSPNLTIQLPRAGDGRRAAKVSIQYSAQPQSGLYFVDAKNAFPAQTPVVYSQGEMEDTRFWIPTWDYPDDKATSAGTIRVPRGWSVLGNGKFLGKTQGRWSDAWRWKMDQPHATYLISIVAGPYTEIVQRETPKRVSFFAPQGLEAWAASAFVETDKMVDFFGKLTGVPYPYAKYSQAPVPDYMFGGMENISATTQTINCLHPWEAKPIRDESGLVAHELAHQWFGDLVSTNGWGDIWINEGWASFLPSFWTRHRHGEDAYDLARYDTFNGGIGGAFGNPTRPLVKRTYNHPFDMFDGITYAGGASRMFMLMRKLGEDRFWAATQSYLNQRKFTAFDTEAFFQSFEKATGEDLSDFKKQWMYTPGVPQLKVTKEGTDLVVAQSAPYYTLDVPVWVRGDQGWGKRMMRVTGAKSRLSLGAEADRLVLVDPEVWTFASISNEIPMTLDERLELFGAAPNMATKARMMDTMFADLTPAQAAAFGRRLPALLQPRFAGRLTGIEGRTLLLEWATGSDLKLAHAAIGALGAAPDSPELRATLASACAHSNPEIKNAAYAARLRVTGDPALAETMWKAVGYNGALANVALGWWTQNNPDLARTKALSALKNAAPEPVRVQAIRTLGQVKDLPGKREVVVALSRVLRERTVNARVAALSSLRQIGTPEAMRLVAPFKNHPMFFIRNAAG